MKAVRPAAKNTVAVVIATTAALFARAWLQLELLQDGLQKDYAADLSYLVVPPILLVLLFPVLRDDREFLLEQFRPADLSPKVILRAVAVGVLIRLSWWGSIIAGVSFGILRSEDPFAVRGPLLSFGCAAAHVVFIGFLVMAVLVPIIEEVTHRSYVQTSMRRYGPVIAVAFSAALFAVLHPLGSWPFTFIAGVIFGAQYWRSGSIWPSLISHATINALIQVDWRCLRGIWNPPPAELPFWRTGVVATCVVIVASISMIYLLRGTKRRRDYRSPRR